MQNIVAIGCNDRCQQLLIENLIFSVHIISIKSEFCKKKIRSPSSSLLKGVNEVKSRYLTWVHNNRKAVIKRSDNTDLQACSNQCKKRKRHQYAQCNKYVIEAITLLISVTVLCDNAKT